MRMRASFWMWVALMAVVAVTSGCGDDDNPTGDNGNGNGNGAPAEWIGRWAGSSSEGPCEGRLFAGGGEPDTFSICEGDRADDLFEGLDVDCNVSWNSTTLQFDCTGSTTFGPCTVNLSFSGLATRSGNQITFSQESEFAYVGECGGEKDGCDLSTGTFTRISTTPDPLECGFGERAPVGAAVPGTEFDPRTLVHTHFPWTP